MVSMANLLIQEKKSSVRAQDDATRRTNEDVKVCRGKRDKADQTVRSRLRVQIPYQSDWAQNLMDFNQKVSKMSREHRV
jgi:hypothetical protein